MGFVVAERQRQADPCFGDEGLSPGSGEQWRHRLPLAPLRNSLAPQQGAGGSADPSGCFRQVWAFEQLPANAQEEPS